MEEGEYEGIMINRKREKLGTMRFINNDIYKGKWRNDKKHGRGIYFEREKNILFEGRWENGEKNGIFIVKNGLEDKKEFIQQYKNGALFNEFLNKQQFDDLKKMKSKIKSTTVYTNRRKYLINFFEDNKKKYLKREKIYTTKYMMYLKN